MMLNTAQILTTLQQLPLPDRMSVLDVLHASVEAEYDQLAEQSLREDILFVEQRLAELDAGETESLSSKEVLQHVFGH